MKKKGFTLVELLAVIAILAILVIIALPNVLKLFRTAKQNTFTDEVQNLVRSAENKYLTSSMNSSNGEVCFDSKTNKLDMTGRDNIIYKIKLSEKGKIIEINVADDNYELIIKEEAGINRADIGNKYKVDTRNKTTEILDCNNNVLIEGEETGKDAIYKIQFIEDLVELSINVDNGETYEGKIFTLLNDLDFQNKNSYKDSETTKYKDINGNGEDEALIIELTTGTGFNPIGTEIKPFSGTIDGNNKKISNLYIHNTSILDNEDFSFIAFLKNGVVKNLTVQGEVITDVKVPLGGIIGRIENSTIDNSVNEIVVTNKTGNYAVGGVVGWSTGDATIKNSTNKANITGGGSTGGIIASNQGGTLTIENCENYGIITNDLGYSVAGLVGQTSHANAKVTTIKNSHNKGNIISNNENDTTQYIGGLIARNNKDLLIENSDNSGDILHSRSNYEGFVQVDIGGIIGLNYNADDALVNTKITKSFNSGNITGGTYIGGLVGYNLQNVNLFINNCYNTATIDNTNITFSTTESRASTATGGLIGLSNGNYSKEFIATDYILNSYNSGYINGLETTGGLKGFSNNTYKDIIINSYNRGNVNNTLNSRSHGISRCDKATTSINEQFKLNNVYNVGNITSFNSNNIYLISFIGTSTINHNITNTYYNNDTIKKGTNLTNDSELTIGKSESEIKTQTFVNTLNTNKNNINLSEIDSNLSGYTLCNWKLGTSGYPELDCK